MSIGVIVEDMTIFSIPDIVDGITDYCDRMNYQIFLVNLRLFKNYDDTYYAKDFYFERVRDEIRKLRNLQVEGIIYVTAHERNLSILSDDIDIPTVMAYGYSQSAQTPSIVVDDVDGMYQLTKTIIEAGHSNIGVITGKADSLHAQARLMGHQKALYEAQIPIMPENIRTGSWERQSGYDNTDKLLTNNVSAIMCMNDLMAGGVYDRLEELGIRVGKDISVTGYDGRQLSSFYKPRLTTVNLPLHDIGVCASKVLLDLLEEKLELSDEPLVFQVPCTLKPAESVARI